MPRRLPDYSKNDIGDFLIYHGLAKANDDDYGEWPKRLTKTNQTHKNTMNRTSHILAAIGLSMATIPLFADSTESDFLRLREKRDKALNAAIQPINDVYRTSLQKLLRHAVAEGEDEAAKQIQFELQSLSESGTAPILSESHTGGRLRRSESEMAKLKTQLTDTKWRLSPDKTFILHADGTSTSNWTPRQGHWKVIDPNTLELSIWNVPRPEKVSVQQGGALIVWLDKEADQAHPQVAKKIEPVE